MPDIDVPDEYRRIGDFYEDLAGVLAWPDEALFGVAADVSAWSPAHHVFHIAVSHGMMFKGIQLISLERSPAVVGGAPTRIGAFVLAQEVMPRGKGTAPEPVRPPETFARADLDRAVARSRERYEKTAALLPSLAGLTYRLEHPYFGYLTAIEWLRVVRIHGAHHLAIIRDIAAGQVIA